MRKTRYLFGMLLAVSITAAVGLHLPASAQPAPAQGKPGQAPPRKTTDPPVAARGKLGQELFLAVDHHDLAGVQSLLKRGADPNSLNGLTFTPLFIAAASHQQDVMAALLSAGAKVDAGSPYGTALTFAALGGNTPGMHLLLTHGAGINPFRADGNTVLMFASRAGDPEAVLELLGRKADVNARNNDGATALIYAAREGQTEVGRALLAAGAAVDGVDSHRWTPLMYAAVSGHAETVRMLLEIGAKPKAREAKGRTALLLAARYGDHPDVIRSLLDGGADAMAADAAGRTASALAAARGYLKSAALLPRAPGRENERVTARLRSPAEAVRASLGVIEPSMRTFNQRTGCISCHQEGLGRMATGAAREHGFRLDSAVGQAQAERINGAMSALKPLHLKALSDPEAMKQVPLVEINEVVPADTWLLAGMAAQNQPATEATGAMAMVLARQQLPDGQWQFSLPRVPMQSSFFTYTALAVRSISAYGPKAYSAEVIERVGRARAWLLTAPTQTSEDRASRLLGLKWAGATVEESRKAIDELCADQGKDGGWSQLTALESDAYATGLALYALHTAGLPVTGPLYARGVQFLLRTQEEDGSWFVNKRALPVNNYFDTGFPHGVSQYASFNGTCWATMALLATVERPRREAAVR